MPPYASILDIYFIRRRTLAKKDLLYFQIKHIYLIYTRQKPIRIIQKSIQHNEL